MSETVLHFENQPKDLESIEHKFFTDVQVLVAKFHQNVEKLASHHNIKVDTRVLLQVIDKEK